ncbi:MAG: UDP-N-acetylmuramoyl-L-alanyl-D-glutamate--2,6-diaminopimelate ligase [Endomicrobium sp.]|jgi:UDP-N-acetylmuramoyl-L-alanyl-D-glutamate--2,6-diaminopimelate ligase|nr:UDP-N-acetylmuramoyl-L-alanyl-D-glutamate--2,6-diaminopimelate ligase [Endomicrobium sp.]
MDLKKILINIKIKFKTLGNLNIKISSISYDSRKIKKNAVFFNLSRIEIESKKHIKEAIFNGASVIVSRFNYNISIVPKIIVKDITKFMAIFSANFYEHPDKDLTIIGITGTNGKTTTTYMLENIFLNNNINCGVIGTINYRYKNTIINSINTTPQSVDIYKIMRDMVNESIKYLIIEISSHALKLNRVFGINFNIAIFTNLTHDHLDFHKNMNNYFYTKINLFKQLNTSKKRYAIINADDKYGKKLIKMKINANITPYAIKNNSSIVKVKAVNIKSTENYNSFNLLLNNTKNEKIKKIKIPYIGIHNTYNALAALISAVYCNININEAIYGLENSKLFPPGRLEKIESTILGFKVFVDYAHTEDAIKNSIQTFINIGSNKIITVFGCGGNRDRTKRPIMGKIAVEMSSFVFITSDNPRMENQNKIIKDIKSGIEIKKKNNFKVVPDREVAIKEAINMANKGDIVLIAGKGHETYQIIGNKKKYFNDIEISKKYILLKEKKNKKSK